MTNRTSRRILITTWGSFGDLHPYVAIGLGLRARGHEVILGTGECYRRKIALKGVGRSGVFDENHKDSRPL
jgi:UDP:flavonoid glycosyltransferase YjiC (YdhE family)